MHKISPYKNLDPSEVQKLDSQNKSSCSDA